MILQLSSKNGDNFGNILISDQCYNRCVQIDYLRLHLENFGKIIHMVLKWGHIGVGEDRLAYTASHKNPLKLDTEKSYYLSCSNGAFHWSLKFMLKSEN